MSQNQLQTKICKNSFLERNLLKLCFKLVDYRRRHLVFIEPEMAKKNGASERLCNNARMVSVAFGKRITHLVMYVPVTM